MNSVSSPEKPIVIDAEVYRHLPADVRLDALILKKQGRLIIQGTPEPAA